MSDPSEDGGDPLPPLPGARRSGRLPLLEPGTLVDHFRIMRAIGRGGMGEVYLARDTKLGRRAALKIVRTELKEEAETVRAFAFEAKTTAKFSHPNIVTVYDVGEYEGRPYVALEYLEGQNLDERINERRPRLTEALRIAMSIASALAEAHAHGVLHLDLKPANIVIPADGRLRVVDFGLARIVGHGDDDDAAPDGTTSVGGWGTPSYVAPEQWRRHEASGATDIWALGVILFQLCSHRLPYEQPAVMDKGKAICSTDPAPRLDRCADVPPELAELVASCLEKEPKRRPPAADVVERLEEILRSSRRDLAVEENPFRGLLPFTDRHAHVFHGRDAEVAAFVERVRHEGVLPVVGPSGAGKSSFVQAGVIPRLREQSDWIVMRLRPGVRPFETLVDRLRRRDGATVVKEGDRSESGELPGDGTPSPAQSGRWSLIPHIDDEDTRRLADQLREAPRQLALWLRRIAEESRRSVLLVVEQLEELFTLVEDDDARRRFMLALCTAADDPLDPVRVIFTVRDDYLGRVATGPEVREVLTHVTVIQSLDVDSLQMVLVRPVEALGYRYEDPQLVREMTAAVRDRPGSLPLVQFAARRLWEQRDTKRRLLLRSSYEAMGGVEGALARHADGVLEILAPHELAMARRILVRLVDADKTRRVVAASRLLDELGPTAQEMVERLAQARLVTVTRSRGAAEPRVELVHESLVRSWATLGRWMDEDREEVGFLTEIGQAADLWASRGRRPEELWQGDALRDALRSLDRCKSAPPAVVIAFIDQARSRERAHRRRKRAVLAATISSLAVVSAGAVLSSFMIADRERQARSERDRAEQQRAEALREAAVAAASEGDVLAARAKLRVALTAQDSPSSRALWLRLKNDPRVWDKQIGSLVYDVAFAPDDTTIAAGAQDASVYVIDTRTRSTRVFRGSDDQVYSVAFSADGALLAGGSWSGTVVVWEFPSGHPRFVLSGHTAGVHALDFDASGRWLASGGSDETVRLWNVESGAAGPVLALGHAVSDVAFRPDAEALAVAHDGGASIWHPTKEDRVELPISPIGDGVMKAVGWDARGRRVAASSHDGRVLVWAADDRALLTTLSGHTAAIHGVVFMPDDTTLVTAGYDHTIRVWNTETGRQERMFSEHEAGVTGLAVDASGRYVASSSRDRSVRLWDLSRSRHVDPHAGHEAGVYRVRFTPDGTSLVSASGDKTLRMWNAATGAQERVMSGHAAGIDSVAVSSDGELVASGSIDSTVRLWDAHSGAQRRVLTGHTSRISGLAFSPDGETIAAGANDGTVRIWDTNTGAPTISLSKHAPAVQDVAFSPDGVWLASAGADAVIRLWHTGTWKENRSLRGHTSDVFGVRFGSSGALLASGSADKTVRLWDLATGTSTVLGPHGGRVYWIAIDPTETYVGAPTSDTTATLWRLSDGRATVLRGHQDEVNSIDFSPDGELAATGGDDGTVRLWHVATGRPHWRAPLLLGDRPPRMLTHRGWVEVGGDGVDVPPAASKWRDAVETNARLAAHDAASGLLCIGGYDDRLQVWDTGSDRVLAEADAEGLVVVRAWSRGCAGLSSRGAWTLDRHGRDVSLEIGGTPIAFEVTDREISVASSDELVVFGEDARVLERRPLMVGITAVGRVDGSSFVGYRDGNFERLGDPADADPVSFSGTTASRVQRIVAGPSDTVVVGHANGVVGMWSLQSGSLLAQTRLHGRVSHLMLQDDELFAATDLGHGVGWDLAVFAGSYCDILREVWAEVPVVWDEGRVLLEEPPLDHPCSGS